ncbi:hypothetical protein ABPG75_012249 [Micractinium tetrahymenae]
MQGALAFFAAQGMAGPGDACPSPRHPATAKHPVFAGFGDASSDRGTSADADLAAPGPGAHGAPKLSEESAAAMPQLLHLSKGEAALKRAAQEGGGSGQAGGGSGGGGGGGDT